MNVMIGIEVHAKLALKRKLFCDCIVNQNEFNTHYCEVCMGQPGALPIPNKSAILMAYRAAKLLGYRINKTSRWSRKHYVFDDLPKGFQETMQVDKSIGVEGSLRYYDGYQAVRDIALKTIILEEDPCADKNGELNYNRSGTSLLEIVTHPVIRDEIEAIKVIKTIINLLGTADIVNPSDKKAFRADINISIDGGNRVEVKNVGSLDEISKIIPLEIERQRKEGVNSPETRAYSPLLGKTTYMRPKESESDYLYLLEPNLGAINRPDTIEVYNVYETYERLLKDYEVSKSDAWTYAKNPKLGLYLLSRRTNLSILNVMIKYGTIDYKLLDEGLSLEEYRVKIARRKESTIDVGILLEGLITEYNLRDSPLKLRYVIGQIKYKTGMPYPQIIKLLANYGINYN